MNIAGLCLKLFQIISNSRHINEYFSTGKCLPGTRGALVTDVFAVDAASDAVLVELSPVSADAFVVDVFDVVSTYTYTEKVFLPFK